MKILPSLLFFLALAGCAPVSPSPRSEATADAPVRLSAERTSAGAIRLTLRNDSSDRVGYNLCTATLQKRSGAWTPVPSDEMCTMQLNTLEPGTSATFDKRLPPGLPPGEYRYVTSVENPLGSSMVEIASNVFTVG
jgi:hypothetical protein